MQHRGDREFTLGRATESDVDFGSLSGADQLEEVFRARRRCRGPGGLPEGLAEGCHHYPATVLSDVPVETEIFGPVMALTNDMPYGLTACLFSENLDRAVDVAERIESGMIAVNKGALSGPAAPSGGVKKSGNGREGGFEGIEEYLGRSPSRCRCRFLLTDAAPAPAPLPEPRRRAYAAG